MADVGFSCDCGAVSGTVKEVAPARVCHLICYCADCRAFARHLGQASKLEPGGGSALVQVAPSSIEIAQGVEHIACLRMSDKGLYRWYARCCKTPIANTVGSPNIPLAGMWRHSFDSVEAFGPVTTLGFTKMGLPGGPKRDKGLLKMLGGLLKRMVAGYLAGTARVSPFFGQDRAPVAEATVLNATQRAAAYKD